MIKESNSLYVIKTDILEENITHIPIPLYLQYSICPFAHIRSLLFVWCKSWWVWKLVTQRCIDPFPTNFETWILNLISSFFLFKTHRTSCKKKKELFYIWATTLYSTNRSFHLIHTFKTQNCDWSSNNIDLSTKII